MSFSHASVDTNSTPVLTRNVLLQKTCPLMWISDRTTLIEVLRLWGPRYFHETYAFTDHSESISDDSEIVNALGPYTQQFANTDQTRLYQVREGGKGEGKEGKVRHARECKRFSREWTCAYEVFAHAKRLKEHQFATHILVMIESPTMLIFDSKMIVQLRHLRISLVLVGRTPQDVSQFVWMNLDLIVFFQQAS
jgi:hypothetical protein